MDRAINPFSFPSPRSPLPLHSHLQKQPTTSPSQEEMQPLCSSSVYSSNHHAFIKVWTHKKNSHFSCTYLHNFSHQSNTAQCHFLTLLFWKKQSPLRRKGDNPSSQQQKQSPKAVHFLACPQNLIAAAAILTLSSPSLVNPPGTACPHISIQITILPLFSILVYFGLRMINIS